MELVSVIRHKVLTEGVPIRDVARQLGLSRNTIRRYVRAKVVPVPRPAVPAAPDAGSRASGGGCGGDLGGPSHVHRRQAAADRHTTMGVAARRRA